MGQILNTCSDNLPVLRDPELHISESNKYLDHFRTPINYVDLFKVFGNIPNIQFIRNKNDENYILLMSQVEGPTATIVPILEEWNEKKMSYTHPNLFVVHKIFVERFYNVMIPTLRLTFLFDYPVQCLADHYNITTKKGFHFKDVWTVLDCITNALVFLQNKNGFSGNVGINQIFLVQTPSGKSVYKILDRFFKGVPQPAVMKFYDYSIVDKKQSSDLSVLAYAQFFANLADKKVLQQLSEQSYLSPALLQSLGKGDKYPIHNVFKSDVFALGVICLYLIDLKENKNLYDFETFQIREDVLKDRLNQLKKFQMQIDFINCLKWMLEIQEEKRPDFIELDEQLTNLAGVLKIDRIKDTITEKDYILNLDNVNRTDTIAHPNRFETFRVVQEQAAEDHQSNDEPSKFNSIEVENVFDLTMKSKIPEEPLIEQLNEEIQASKMGGSLSDNPRQPKIYGGTIHYTNGCYYVGEVTQELRNGKGIFFDKDGRILVEGTFSMDKMHGKVVIHNYPEGLEENDHDNHGHFDLTHRRHPWVRFEGTAKYGQREGLGVLNFANGDKFSGEFVGDQIDGQGEYIYANGKVIKGRWSNNKFIEYLK